MNYQILSEQAAAMLDEEPWYVAAMSNLSALLMASMDRLNWAGFYFVNENGLTVGPFQGKPACIHIGPGKGVCGAAVTSDKVMLVPDVHEFPGHIACDSASESEIVVPIHDGDRVAAVLDIDSPVKNRFSEEDAEGLSAFVRVIEEKLRW